jgi:hypothetical protein
MSRALAELQLLPSPVPAGSILKIALWYADVLKQLETLPGKLRQRLEAEGERIADIVGITILPRVHHLAHGFPFKRLFKAFGDHMRGRWPNNLLGLL